MNGGSGLRESAHVPLRKKKLDGPNLTASALHYIGNEESRALLESLQPNEPAMRGAFSWAIRDIDARLKQQP